MIRFYHMEKSYSIVKNVHLMAKDSFPTQTQKNTPQQTYNNPHLTRNFIAIVICHNTKPDLTFFVATVWSAIEPKWLWQSSNKIQIYNSLTETTTIVI